VRPSHISEKDLAWLMNHSEHANCYVDGNMFVFPKHNIKAGSPLTIDYGQVFWSCPVPAGGYQGFSKSPPPRLATKEETAKGNKYLNQFNALFLNALGEEKPNFDPSSPSMADQLSSPVKKADLKIDGIQHCARIRHKRVAFDMSGDPTDRVAKRRATDLTARINESLNVSALGCAPEVRCEADALGKSSIESDSTLFERSVVLAMSGVPACDAGLARFETHQFGGRGSPNTLKSRSMDACKPMPLKSCSMDACKPMPLKSRSMDACKPMPPVFDEQGEADVGIDSFALVESCKPMPDVQPVATPPDFPAPPRWMTDEAYHPSAELLDWYASSGTYYAGAYHVSSARLHSLEYSPPLPSDDHQLKILDDKPLEDSSDTIEKFYAHKGSQYFHEDISKPECTLLNSIAKGGSGSIQGSPDLDLDLDLVSEVATPPMPEVFNLSMQAQYILLGSSITEVDSEILVSKVAAPPIAGVFNFGWVSTGVNESSVRKVGDVVFAENIAGGWVVVDEVAGHGGVEQVIYID
jgi:hypothetical protein